MSMKKKIVLIGGYPVEVNEESKDWSINSIKSGFFTIRGNYQGNFFSSSIIRDGNKYNVNINGSSYVVEPVPDDFFSEQDRINNDESKILAPMTGVVRDILVNKGDEVIPGQLLLRIESMKLVLSVNSSKKGIIKEIRVKTGQRISSGDFILELNI